MEEKNELIILEQLPIIKTRLEKISTQIKQKVDKATSLVVNEDTVKEVKQVRANLTKEFNELEEQRKKVKNAIMQKYDEFNDIYVANVSNLYKQADAELKEKIDNVENQLKKEKEDELREFVKQHCEANKIHIEFEKIGLNITLSASMKSLKDQALEFIEKVTNDLKLIELEEYSSEILYEYNQCMDYVVAKTKALERHKQLEELEKQQEQKQELEKEEEKVVEKVEEIVAPKEIIEDTEVIKVSFTLTGTKEQIKKVKDLIVELGIEYE